MKRQTPSTTCISVAARLQLLLDMSDSRLVVPSAEAHTFVARCTCTIAVEAGVANVDAVGCAVGVADAVALKGDFHSRCDGARPASRHHPWAFLNVGEP